MSKQQLCKSIIDQSDETFQAKFEKLIEQHKNESVKKIVEKLSPSVPLTTVFDFSGTTLLHLAAKYNNVDLITYFAKSGCNLNAKNSFDTPLSTAFVNYHVEAVDALLGLGAELGIEDVERILRKFIAEKEMPEPTIAALMQRLKRCTKDTKTMTALLMKVKCPLKFVVYMGDVRLTREILPRYRIDNQMISASLEYSMKAADMGNLRLFWHLNSTKTYYDYVFNALRAEALESSVNSGYHSVFKQLNKWIVLDRDFVGFLWSLFQSAEKSTLRILLQECNFDVQIKQDYQFEVLPMLFSNWKIDNEDMFQLVCKRRFDVNAKSFGGYSALHFAVSHNLQDKVRLLLEMGADCNAKDDHGWTAFTLINHVKCCEAFLQGTSQLRIGENYETKVLSGLRLDYSSASDDLRPILLAQLAIESCQGVRITRKIVDEIRRCRSFQQHYDYCLRQVKQMMNYEVLTSLTMFSILTTKAEKLLLHIQSLETVLTITQWCSQQYLHPFYASTLKFNSEKAHNLYRSRYRVVDIIHKNTSVLIYYDDLVIDKILGYLVYRDMLVLASV